jgi:tryptophan-rich sensory protein
VLGWGDRRERFNRELANLASMESAAVIVECEMSTLLANAPERGVKTAAENRKLLFRQILAWQQQYRVPWIFCDGRHMAEIAAYRRMLADIDRADYLVLSSNRASDTLPRVPLRWPVMARFYERLLSPDADTRIGLREVVRFERFPSLGGWALKSHQAEEAFHVYDHPSVRIYEKTRIWETGAIHDLLSENIVWEDIPDIRYRHAGGWNNGWLTPGEWNARRSGRPVAQLFPANSAGNRAPITIWVIVLFTLGGVSLPAVWLLFPSLRDRGTAVSRILGLLAIGGMAWLPAACGWMRFGPALHIAGTLWFAGAAAIFAWKHEAFLRWLRKRKARILFSELLFWSVFAAFLWLRTRQPDLWHPWAGGEKPMDLAFLNATAQSPYFPPPNPWLSGAFLNYYHYGFVLCSVLIRATGILPSTAYNLLLPTFAALGAGAVASIASLMVSTFRSRPGWRGVKTASILAILLTFFLGNFGQLRWLLQGRPGHPSSGYWAASRVIAAPAGEVQPITEFPFFTLLYGDLHAHLMALPIAAFCLLLSLQLLRRFHPARLFVSALALGAKDDGCCPDPAVDAHHARIEDADEMRDAEALHDLAPRLHQRGREARRRVGREAEARALPDQRAVLQRHARHAAGAGERMDGNGVAGHRRLLPLARWLLADVDAADFLQALGVVREQPGVHAAARADADEPAIARGEDAERVAGTERGDVLLDLDPHVAVGGGFNGDGDHHVMAGRLLVARGGKLVGDVLQRDFLALGHVEVVGAVDLAGHFGLRLAGRSLPTVPILVQLNPKSNTFGKYFFLHEAQRFGGNSGRKAQAGLRRRRRGAATGQPGGPGTSCRVPGAPPQRGLRGSGGMPYWARSSASCAPIHSCAAASWARLNGQERSAT